MKPMMVMMWIRHGIAFRIPFLVRAGRCTPDWRIPIVLNLLRHIFISTFLAALLREKGVMQVYMPKESCQCQEETSKQMRNP